MSRAEQGTLTVNKTGIPLNPERGKLNLCKIARSCIRSLLLLLLLVTPGSGGEKYKPSTLVFPTRMHAPIRKGTKFHLFLYMQNRVKINNPQGVAVTRLTSWDDPKEKGDDDEVTVYGVNSGQNVIIYNTSKLTVSVYGLNERGEGKLNAPHGITAAPWGDVYVADTGNNRVVHLYNPSKNLAFKNAVLAGELLAPTDVALTADSSLFVTDTGNNRVLWLRADTLHKVLVESGSSAPGVIRPTGIAAISRRDRWNFWRQDFIVVIDQGGMRIQKFGRNGQLLAAVQTADFGLNSADFQYLMIDYYNNIWVSDRENHCLHKFDRNLKFLTTFGRRGDDDFEFIQPRGIALYRRFGQVLVAEKESAQYYWVGTDVKNFAAVVDTNGMLDITYYLTERSNVTIEILDSRGQVLAKPMPEVQRLAGENFEKLGGNWRTVPFFMQRGKRLYRKSTINAVPPVAPGTYRVKMTIAATYSSYRYFKKEIERTVLVQ